MRFRDAFITATAALRHGKARSLLTILGIVIGIASVILLLSIGTSAQQLILNQVQGIGSNLIFIIPGATKGSFDSPPSVQGIIIKTLVEKDAQALRKEPAINKVAPEIRGAARAIYGNKDTVATFDGINGDFFPIRDFKVDRGRQFTEQDVTSFNRVAVLGSEVAKTLFGSQNPIGKIFRLKEISFTVVGILEKKGVGPFGVDQDSLVLVPVSIAQKQLLGIDYYNSLTLQVNPAYTIDFAKARITSVLRQTHRITDPDKDDFTIRTQADALSILGNITTILKVFLAAIASISLLVGGIGIMNIMLVSVTERTMEIGLRKSLGATNGDILEQFLIESVLLTCSGGVIGILAGSTMTTLVYLIVTQIVKIDWVFALPLSAILLAVGVSTVTGLLFGLYPARQASRKDPIEALRYE